MSSLCTVFLITASTYSDTKPHAYKTAKKELASSLQTARSLRERALEMLSNGAKSSTEEGLTFWNLQFYDRPLRAELSRLPESATRFLTIDNQEVVSQRTCDNTLLLSAPNIVIPALGKLSIREINQPPGKPRFSLVGTDSEIENEFLKVIVDGDGTISSIYDKEHEREVLADRANQIWLYTDIPRRFDAWDIDSSYVTEGIELKAADNPVLIESGPIRSAIRVTRRVAETVIINLNMGSIRILETGELLQCAWPETSTRPCTRFHLRLNRNINHSCRRSA
jgi:alpha-mannosidase